MNDSNLYDEIIKARDFVDSQIIKLKNDGANDCDVKVLKLMHEYSSLERIRLEHLKLYVQLKEVEKALVVH